MAALARQAGPVRSYQGSRVPLASRGYVLNTQERKVFDIDVASYAVDTTGSITLLADPQVGADMNQRIGRKILLKSVYIRGYVRTEAATSTLPLVNTIGQMGRFIIFADLQPNGAAPAVTALLKEASPASQLNIDNRDRFKVYCDREFIFDPYGASTTATQTYLSCTNQIRAIKKFKKINLEMIFNATNGGTIADVNSGALYMLWIGNVAAGTNTNMSASLSTRVRYSDM